MSDLIFRISPNIVLGSYTAARAGQFARDWGSRYIVLIDPVVKELGVADGILQSLTDRKVEFFQFDEMEADADSEIIQRALSLARKAHVHGLIAVGGAKTLNLGRAVSAVYNEVHDLYDFIDGAVPSTAPLPMIAIPSTIRDTFVFTDRVPVVDSRSRHVKLIKAQPGLCKMALFDSNLSVSLTENQIAAMSIETLCLAVEAYVSQKATFFSDMLAEKAFEVLGYALDGGQSLAVTTPPEVLLSMGGCLASLAVATGSPGPASLLALAVNARFRISRALTVSILFPYIIEDMAKYKVDRLAKIARMLRLADADAAPEQAAALLAENARRRLAQANLPSRLKDLSISIEQFSLAAEDAGQLELMNGLPRSMTADDLFELIKLAY
ncbi:iron-containing alcohol dehydrogenase [Treponema brennaborense]|uniref:Iron-containing alcohol dehydrogenase n=1 Tax=Treponema brennaborense (strain DSM 12168 / CIP 105900 / DD5/3) TaxID=906968 RepID=F4LNE8_TREBD|nr:iron-containing alcohol dehydrogenase [Treponema brennaborense]AEE17906.1 iron-containing alcohol dehydrogenase [Treponema brennaborense DSM 12168]